MLRFRLVPFMTFLIPIPLILNAGSVSQPGALFLKIPVGVRSAGMGEAYTAVAEDASATWWNPAGLAFMRRSEISYMRSKYLPHYNLSHLRWHYYGSFHHIKEFGTVGVNFILFDYGDIQRTSEIGTDLGKFHTYDISATCACGFKVNENLALGLSLKFIYSHLSPLGSGQEKGSGIASVFAVDLSTLYKLNLSRLFYFPEARFFRFQLGANLANIGPKISYIDRANADPLPTNLRTGLAFIFQYQDYVKATMSYEVEKELVTRHSDDSTDPVYQAMFTSWYNDGGFMSPEEREEFITHFGVEVWAMNIFALRFGHWNDPRGKVDANTWGLSLQYMIFRFDCSYLWAGKDHLMSDTKKIQFSLYFDHIKRFSFTPWK